MTGSAGATHEVSGGSSASARAATASAVLRVLLYTPVFFPSAGGMETFAARLAGGLQEVGVEVALITDTPSHGDAQQSRYPIVRRPPLRRQVAAVRWADVIHLSGFDLQLFLLAKAFRKPIVWSHHDYIPPVCARPMLNGGSQYCGPLHIRVCWQHFLRESSTIGALRDFARMSVQLAARHFVGAHVVGLDSHWQALRLSRAQVIPYWTDPSSDSERVTLLSRPTVVFASRHLPGTRGKGGDILLRALARLLPEGASWRVVFSNDGPARQEWMEFAARLDIPAEFLGPQPSESLPELLRQADVVVVPTRYPEYFGLVALEAMVQGTYVVASASGGLGEFVSRCGGAVFPASDDAALAAILRELLGDRERTRALGQAVRTQALRQFSKAHSIRAYVELYERLYCDSHRRRDVEEAR